MTIRWDELRFVLAVARKGSVAGAARMLKVTESTVARHLSELERDLETRLFERLPTGYELTEPGRRVLARAERIEAEVAAVELDVRGSDGELRGPVHITVPEQLAALTVTMVAGFVRDYPDIVPTLNISDASADLGRRQSDIAIRMARNPPGNLVGRRIADYAMAVYAARDYAASQAERGEPMGWLGIRPGDDESIPRWIAEVAPDAQMCATIDQVTPTVLAARSGMGLARLPCFLGDAEPELCRLGPTFTAGYAVWLLTHEKLRSTGRVKLLMDHLATGLSALRDRFAGRVGADDSD
ncbi:MAG: LysR family transcriptional regulator [Myxococcota bacterium]